MIQYQSENIIVFESALFRTTSTLIYTDDLILLVDPTWLPNEIEIIKANLQKIKNTQQIYLLFTHSDYDHILAYGAFPEAKVIVSKAFVNNPDEEKVLQQILDFDDEYYITRDYPISYPQADIIIEGEGQTLQEGNTQIHFYQAPGHNRDGIFTLVQPLGIFIAGDYLSNIEFPYIYHSSYDYENTLDTFNTILDEHTIQLLVPGHGDVTSNQQEMQKREMDSRQYITHLRQSIIDQQIFDFEQLMKPYQFPKIMRQFHDGNVALMKKELGKVE